MCDFLATLVVAGSLYSACFTPVEAQNTTCSDRPSSDSSNACANTRYVTNAGTSFRTKLLANTSYFVDDILGSDSNTCLAATTSACKTLNGAVAKLQLLDLNSFTATVNVAAPASSYAGMTCSEPWTGLGAVVFTGDTTTPTNVAIAGGSANGISVSNGCVISVQGFSISSTSLNGVSVINAGSRVTFGRIDFGAALATGSQVFVGIGAAYVDFNGATTVHGNAGTFVTASHVGHARFVGSSITWTGNSTYGTATMQVDGGDIVGTSSVTISIGAFTVTGPRYSLIHSGILQWNANAPPLPADLPGTTAGSYNFDSGTSTYFGATSGSAVVRAKAVAGSGTIFQLPSGLGSSGNCLVTDGAGAWEPASCGLIVGTTPITSGTTTRILYDNAGVLGEYTISGTGTVVAMQTSPALITPSLGIATGTSLALNGCTISTNDLCTAGTTLHGDAVSITKSSANATFTGITVTNTNTGAAANVTSNFAVTDAGTMNLQAVSAAGGAFSIVRWSGSGGLFFDQKNASGSMTFRTGSTPSNALVIDASQVVTISAGNVVMGVATKTLVLKQGANGTVGTFVCTSGGSITVNNSNVAINDAIIISLNTAGGTISNAPALNAITAATSFVAKCATNDTATYNYAIIKNAA